MASSTSKDAKDPRETIFKEQLQNWIDTTNLKKPDEAGKKKEFQEKVLKSNERPKNEWLDLLKEQPNYDVEFYEKCLYSFGHVEMNKYDKEELRKAEKVSDYFKELRTHVESKLNDYFADEYEKYCRGGL